MTKRKTAWLDSRAAAQALAVEPRFLNDRRKAGDFKAGVHYRIKNPRARKHRYQYHVSAIESLWSTASGRSKPAIAPEREG